jgi:putative ABC transport system substrate-binding protein
MKRREFITLLGGMAATRPLAAHAQTKRARIGWFTVAPHPYIDDFRRGLRELGWIEGENLVIEPIYADGHPERLPGLAAELARVPYDLVVASGSDALEAARAAIQSIPIVGILAGVFPFQLTSLRNLGSSLEACLCGPSQLIARAV